MTNKKPKISPFREEGEPPICSVECEQWRGTTDPCVLRAECDCGEVCVPAVLRMQEELKAAKEQSND